MIIEYVQIHITAYNIRKINDTEDIWRFIQYINDPQIQLWYCHKVNDREEIWKALANSKISYAIQYQYFYCTGVKNRKEMEDAISQSSYELAYIWQDLYNKRMMEA